MPSPPESGDVMDHAANMTQDVTNSPEIREVRVGERRIGAGQPVYVIAEAGVNHDGSRADALRLVEIAAQAGADAVKFQAFRAAELVTQTAPTAAYQRQSGAESQYEMLRRLELSDADFAEIRAHCRRCGVDFLATPFGSTDVRRLVALEVAAIKIASTDLVSRPLLHDAARTGLPIILSTGAATPDEIGAAVAWLREWSAGERLLLLHCVSAYPTPPEAANLRAVRTLTEMHRVPCGFSDHTTLTDSGALAVAAGACVLEKHFTLDRSRPGPDHAMSLDPDALRHYVAKTREAEVLLGSGRLGAQQIEIDVRRVARKSVVAQCDISAGSVLRDAHLAIKRPGGGICPSEIETLLGKVARVDIARDTQIRWDMLR